MHYLTGTENAETKRGIRLPNIKYPKFLQKKSDKDAEATLASMETLEDKLDTPNDGMENVKLDGDVRLFCIHYQPFYYIFCTKYFL